MHPGVVIWHLLRPVAGCNHRFKYRFYFGRPDGTCLVRYDNERGKGDHRHCLDREQPIERVYFHDVKTFLKYITPKRFELLDNLHHNDASSVRGLAKLLNRHYKNVFDDVKLLELIGLVEKDEAGLYSVSWDEVSATFKLAA